MSDKCKIHLDLAFVRHGNRSRIKSTCYFPSTACQFFRVTEPSAQRTDVAANDRGPHHQADQLVQDQVQELHQRLPTGIHDVHDASLQLILKGILVHAWRQLLLKDVVAQVHEAVDVFILKK